MVIIQPQELYNYPALYVSLAFAQPQVIKGSKRPTFDVRPRCICKTASALQWKTEKSWHCLTHPVTNRLMSAKRRQRRDIFCTNDKARHSCLFFDIYFGNRFGGCFYIVQRISFCKSHRIFFIFHFFKSTNGTSLRMWCCGKQWLLFLSCWRHAY